MNHLDNGVEVAPAIFVFDNFIDNSEEIIHAAMKKGEMGFAYDAQIGSDNKDEDFRVDKKIRDTVIVDISPVYSNDVMWWLLAQKLWRQGDSYGKHHGVGFSEMEFPQFLFYPKNKGFYKPHADSGTSMSRVFSSVLYLNDVEEGGETYFEKFDVEVKPVAGRLVMFPADFAYKHGAKTPLSNNKCCIVTWFAPEI